VQPGELVGLLGPNGAGKSTLVKAACGLVHPTSGEVRVCGAAAGSRAARVRLGYLPETFRQPAWCTAEELLRLHQRLAGVSPSGDQRSSLLTLVGLPGLERLRVDAMSKGMAQRLALATSLVGDPALLLLDEPTSALDPVGRRLVRQVLEHLRDQGVAVLLNSHLLSEVELVCDRVVILRAGRVVAEGTPQELSHPSGLEVETSAGTQVYPGVRREDVPALVAKLVREGQQVYAVRPLGGALEDAYLAAVEGEAS
jgi:ABC-2 type transport system ATP-binding protein